MTSFDAANINVSKRVHLAAQPPIMISQDGTRQGPTDRRMLYVLGFGIAGAIFANILVFIYFASFYASG